MRNKIELFADRIRTYTRQKIGCGGGGEVGEREREVKRRGIIRDREKESVTLRKARNRDRSCHDYKKLDRRAAWCGADVPTSTSWELITDKAGT